jgi:hypothetical protein
MTFLDFVSFWSTISRIHLISLYQSEIPFNFGHIILSHLLWDLHVPSHLIFFFSLILDKRQIFSTVFFHKVVEFLFFSFCTKIMQWTLVPLILSSLSLESLDVLLLFISLKDIFLSMSSWWVLLSFNPGFRSSIFELVSFSMSCFPSSLNRHT